MNRPDSVTFRPIGTVHSPFKEKFGIPRQPGLVPEVEARIGFHPPFDRPEAFAGLDAYSHIWVQFVFHGALEAGWQPKVRPPRLGGNRRVGVFASRSPFRPNPIGLSVVRLVAVDLDGGRVSLRIAGADLLDGTPVLDIKPYVEYVDSLRGTRRGFAPAAPEPRRAVIFSARAEARLAERADGAAVRRVIEGLLALDPRPAFRQGEATDRVYGMRLYDFDLRWRVGDPAVEVLDLVPVESEPPPLATSPRQSG